MSPKRRVSIRIFNWLENIPIQFAKYGFAAYLFGKIIYFTLIIPVGCIGFFYWLFIEDLMEGYEKAKQLALREDVEK